MQEFKAFANRLADDAGKIAREYFRQPFDVITKTDDSPVTIADRTIEQALRNMIETTYPDHGIYGEEFGVKDSQNGYTWVIDPIDGTKSFVVGRPTFGTLIALCKDDVPILGVIDQPILKERWVGVDGQETTLNGVPVKTRACSKVQFAVSMSTAPDMFKGDQIDIPEKIKKLCKTQVWGGDCYAYGLLASGFVDVVIEDSLSPYDFCALVPVVQGAGGQITDWSGAPLTIKSKGDVVALGDKDLWPDVQNIVSSGI